MRRSRIRRVVLALPLLTLLVTPLSLASLFQPIAGSDPILYADTVWPTESRVLSSPFGPREKASEDFRYDFHRGIDIPDEPGSPIFSIADGEIFRTFYEGDRDNPYPSGGTVLIIRHHADHPFELAGTTHTMYYSVYMHLQDIDVPDALPGGPYLPVSKGQRVASMGSTGTTTFVHLHFEVRVGTTCSIESSCSRDYDPHVNPLMFLEYPDTNSLNVQVVSVRPLRVRVSSHRNELDFNAITVNYGDMSSHIDFNTREGIDPYDIDRQTIDDVTISPFAFNSESGLYEIEFRYNHLADYDSIEVTDFNGNGLRLSNTTPQFYDAISLVRALFSRSRLP